MAAANESQGLKIAVAAFVTLTVILAVTTYFGFSSYSEANAKLAEAQQTIQTKDTAAREAIGNLDDLKSRAGYPPTKYEEYPSVKDAIKKDEAQLKENVTAMVGKIQGMIDQYRQAIQQNNVNGVAQADVERLVQAANEKAAQILNEPNPTFQSTQQHMMELMDNMAQLTTAMSMDNQGLRSQLAMVNQANDQQLQIQLTAVQKSEQDKESELVKHEQSRRELAQTNDQLSTQNDQLIIENRALKDQIAQLTEDFGRNRDLMMAQLRGVREELEKSEVVLDQADGYITFVDYGRSEVRTDINRTQGAKPQMHFAIFDRDAPGLPTDKPKGTIELIHVGNQGSIGRIIETTRSDNPIRDGDQVYSAAWSPEHPEKFALIGAIDFDRDSKDDREDLKRMIRSAGGEIVYDLPPPGVGAEQGKITPEVSWYISDASPSSDDRAYLDKRSAAISEARLVGVRPMSLKNILAYLNYSYGRSVPGQVEAINRDAVNRLLHPQGATGELSTPQPDEEGMEENDNNPGGGLGAFP